MAAVSSPALAVTLVPGAKFSTLPSDKCVSSFALTVFTTMKLPRFPFRKKVQDLSKQDEKIFAEASELAQLRLEQCIADLDIWPPAIDHPLVPRGHRPLRKFSNLF
jgi:hypothetical protein